MKTASSRAVELNEQFLRRTGADLHDGPAQLIGYAMLRINEISNKEVISLTNYSEGVYLLNIGGHVEKIIKQ